MKKLLALVLCVMLFVSVIPTAAFANTSANSAVSLYNAVQQSNKLYNALSHFAAAKTISGLYNGFAKNYKDLITNSEGAKTAMAALFKLFGEVTTSPIDKDYVLTSSLNQTVATLYDDIRQAYVGEVIDDVTKENVAKAKGTLTGAIAATELKVIDSMPTLTEVSFG